MDRILELSPVKKILVANRGEIALRIDRAARLLQIPTVAVFSGKELDSHWIRSFNESLSLGNGNLAETYLNIPLIISLARQSGADAIHPGYGFLSENFLFAQACEENDIRFIGPPSSVLKLMGDKLSAHEFVAGLGVPVNDKIINTPHEISRNGHNLDYPVLVKAAAGGGGKGMRIVRSHHELTGILEVTANEALRYFADERVYIEKYLHAPRHIEVQVLGDSHGHIVHLFERECSIQRRHQKIMEEAPAACLTDDLRKRIIAAALKIANSVNYVNAGTIEFLLGENGDFFFLEMNTRIQVEHGITEMITGIDLVKEQIRIAGGYPLPFTQADILSTGYAIEARIYAEDPENDLLPSPGTIHYFNMPDLDNVRLESAVSSGSVVDEDFDPLIAKVIAMGNTRDNAVQALDHALEKMVITGVRHNVPLIRSILQDHEYLTNSISTAYLQDKLEILLAGIKKRKQIVKVAELIMAAAILALTVRNQDHPDSVWQSVGHWRVIPRMSFRYLYDRYGIYYHRTGNDSMYIWQDNRKFSLSGIKADDHMITFTCEDKIYNFYHSPEVGGMLCITSGDLDFELHRTDRLKSRDFDYLPEDESDPEQEMIRSPLPGKVTRLFVSLNEKVSRGDNLMTIESMKLENSILAPFAGTVEEIRIGEGEQVKRYDPLILLNPAII